MSHLQQNRTILLYKVQLCCTTMLYNKHFVKTQNMLCKQVGKTQNMLAKHKTCLDNIWNNMTICTIAKQGETIYVLHSGIHCTWYSIVRGKMIGQYRQLIKIYILWNSNTYQPMWDKLYWRRIVMNESNCLVRSRLMTVRPTAGMINLIFGQMAGITRAYSAEPLAIAIRGKCTTWLCAYSIAIDRCYVHTIECFPNMCSVYVELRFIQWRSQGGATGHLPPPLGPSASFR